MLFWEYTGKQIYLVVLENWFPLGVIQLWWICLLYCTLMMLIMSPSFISSLNKYYPYNSVTLRAKRMDLTEALRKVVSPCILEFEYIYSTIKMEVRYFSVIITYNQFDSMYMLLYWEHWAAHLTRALWFSRPKTVEWNCNSDQKWVE